MCPGLVVEFFGASIESSWCGSMLIKDFYFWCVLISQTRKEAFEQRKNELKALGLGQDGRPIKEQEKASKSRGRVSKCVCFLSRVGYILQISPRNYVCFYLPLESYTRSLR